MSEQQQSPPSFDREDHETVIDVFLAGHSDNVGLPALRDAVAALQRDRRRLDWMTDRSLVNLLIVTLESGRAVVNYAAPGAKRYWQSGHSLREAIDAVMAREGSNG